MADFTLPIAPGSIVLKKLESESQWTFLPKLHPYSAMSSGKQWSPRENVTTRSFCYILKSG